MPHITYSDIYGTMAYPNLQTGSEFTVSFVITSTIKYELNYLSNSLSDPDRPI